MTAMTGATGRHDRYRELAATALDFPLSRAEAAELAAHLATCGACARLAAGLRADAALLRQPAELPTSYRLDTAVGAAIAGRRPAGQASRTLLLVAATALLGAALLGAAAVGAYLWRTLNPPTVLLPSPPPFVVPSPDPSGEPGPAVPALTWQLGSIPPMVAGGNAYPTAVGVGAEGFVAVGGRIFRDNDTPSGATASAWRSADGLAWTPAATEGLALGSVISIDDEPAPGIADVAWGPAGWVAVGIDIDDAGRRVAAIWHADDGATWERMLPRGELAESRDFADYQARVRPAAVTWDGSNYVMVGVLREEGAPRAAAWLSTDGRSFNQVPDGGAFDIGGYVTLPSGYATGGPLDVVVLPDGSLFAPSRTCTATADMEEQPVCRAFAMTSRDGTTWEREDLPGETPATSVAAAGDRVVALAGTGTDGSALVMLRDAADWRLVGLPGVPALARVIAYGDGFLAASIAGNEVSLYASPDGEAWSRLPGVPQPPDVAVLRTEVDLATDGTTVVVVGSAETASGSGPGGFAIVGTPPAAPPEASPAPTTLEVTPSIAFSGFESADLAALVIGPDGSPYLLDRATATVYRVDTAGNRAVPVYRAGERVDGTSTRAPRHLAVAAQDVLILDDGNRLWRWRPAEPVAERRLAGVRVAEAAAWGTDVLGIGTFVRDAETGLYNLYVVDPSERQVLRYTPAADGSGFPTAATAYLEAPRDLAQETAVHVDGDLYLAVGGSLARFEQGREVAGWPAAEPGGAARDYRFTSSPDARREGYLYAFDAAGPAVVAIAKGDGSVVAEYRLPANAAVDWSDVRGVSVTADDAGARRLWWIDGGRLLTASLGVGPIAREPAPPTWASGQLLVDLGQPRGVRILAPGGDIVAYAPSGSLGPMAAWSPDGSRVAMTITTDGEQAVVVVDVASGTEVARIDGAYAPTWSRDGERLAYCGGRIDQAGAPCPEVWLAAADGTGAERLGGGWHGPLTWSPDGRWLLGRTLGTGTPEPFQLIDTATGTATPLGDPAGCYDDPSWRAGPSPTDGGRLAVIAIRDLGCTGTFPTPTVVVALDVATGREARLTDGSAADAGPAVSPDWRRLAVNRSLTGEPGGPHGIVVMGADGSDPHVVTPPDANTSGPAWSPDGAWILAQREPSTGESPGDSAGLVLFAPDGSTSIAVVGTAGATGWAWRPSARPSVEP